MENPRETPKMKEKFNTIVSRPTVFEQGVSAVASSLSKEAVYSLYKKSQKSNIPFDTLETVYQRGYAIWNESFGDSPENFAFDRVNSFIAGGFATDLDIDLFEKNKNDNNMSARDIVKLAHKNGFMPHRTTGSHDLHKHPDGRMIAVPRHKGNIAPGTTRQLIRSIHNEAVEEPKTTDKSKPSSRFVGTKSLVDILKKDTPGQTMKESNLSIIKRTIKK